MALTTKEGQDFLKTMKDKDLSKFKEYINKNNGNNYVPLMLPDKPEELVKIIEGLVKSFT